MAKPKTLKDRLWKKSKITANIHLYMADLLRVVDGDTIDVLLDLGYGVKYKTRVRLSGIDTAESRTRNLDEKKYGLEAKAWLKARLKAEGGRIVIKSRLDKKGKYGRVMGTLLDHNGVDINNEMLLNGQAIPYGGNKKLPWKERKLTLNKARDAV